MDSNLKNNKYSVSVLNNICEIIESMNKFNQIQILKILSKNNVTLNENNYGIHINISELDEHIIVELLNYITYFNKQEQTLNSLEKKQEDYKKTYFSNVSAAVSD